jgi:hypothetical protein
LLDLAGTALRNRRGRPLAIVLGVTPGIMELQWPADVTLLALDHSLPMINAQWQANESAPSVASCARWQAMPVPDGVADAIVGDGSLNALSSLADYPDVLSELARVVKRDGVIVLRFFIRPPGGDSVEEIMDAVMRRAFPTSATFRFRLTMALTKDDGSVVLGEFLDQFNALFPDREKLAAAAGWPMDEIDRFDMDRGSRVALTFPDEATIRAIVAPFFDVISVRQGSYPLADRCPTVAFAPKR